MLIFVVIPFGMSIYTSFTSWPMGQPIEKAKMVGLLTLQENGDPLDAAAWRKSPVPVMVTEERNGLYGPGHNSFTVDEDGRDIIVFHARPYPGFHGDALSDPNRHCFLRNVEYTEEGIPVFSRGE